MKFLETLGVAILAILGVLFTVALWVASIAIPVAIIVLVLRAMGVL